MESNDINFEEITTAVVKIQRIWRRYIVKLIEQLVKPLLGLYFYVIFLKDVQVFRYYKDLVTFHNEGLK